MQGDVIDLRESLAEAVNKDSPGVLVPVAVKPAVTKVEKPEGGDPVSEKKGKTAENDRLGKAKETRDPKKVGDRGQEELITPDTFGAVKNKE